MSHSSSFDGSWRRRDHLAFGSADARALVERLVTVAGYARTLDVGSGQGQLVLELLAQGIDALGIDTAPLAMSRANAFAPGRFREASVLNLPFDEGAFGAVVAVATIDRLPEADIEPALREIGRVCGGTLFVRVATADEPRSEWPVTAKPREWWENRMFATGFRKHPLAQAVVPYEALETERGVATIVMEKIPAGARGRYELADLKAERDLRVDMTREAGRHSDAHIARYMLAGRYVRPGDTVLDAACGLGCGSHILAHSTGAARVIGVDSSSSAIAYATANFASDGDRVSFHVADAQDLSLLPDHSVDMIVSMETLQHLPEPLAFLSEARRLLRPSGRIIVSVLNQWLDDAGRDQNPHHLHVYGLSKLREHISHHFNLEQLWLQTAGGGIKYPHAPRRMVELPASGEGASAAEWLIALAMKSPLASHPALRDGAFPQAERAGGHVVAFDRWYRNPWLPRAIVTRGGRATGSLLDKYVRNFAATAERDSADRGAALCVSAYRLLEQRQADHFPSEVAALRRDLKTYIEFVSENPHVHRWQISCAYALALLCRSVGDLEGAANALRACIARDPLQFSPLLATKTLSAHAELAKFYLTQGDLPSSRKTLEDALIKATKLIGSDWPNVIGLTNDPYPFGFHELAELADIASRCALMLEALNRGWSQPFIVARTRITHADARLAEVDALLRQSECARQALMDSTSWQLTAPLRAAAAAARRMLRRAAPTPGAPSATVLSNSPADGRAGTVDVSMPPTSQEPGGSARHGARLAVFRRRARRLAEIARSEGVSSSIRAAVDHMERRYFPYRLLRRRRALLAPQAGLDALLKGAAYQAGASVPGANGRVIAMLVDTFTDGGMERVTIDLCRSLRRKGYVPLILVVASAGRSAQEARAHGLTVEEFGGSPSRVAAWLTGARPSLVFAHHCYFELQQFKAAGVPIVEVLHNAYFWQVGEAYVARQRRSNVDAFVAVSDFVRDYAICHLGVPANDITTIPNGLDVAGLVRPPLDLLIERRLQTLQTPQLVFVANLHPQKNHRGVVCAFSRVLQRYPAAKLKIAGTLDGNEALRRRIEADVLSLGIQPSVDFLGPLNRRQLSRLLTDAHVGLLPTYAEGFSIVTLEYAFFALPSVLSDTGAACWLERTYGHTLLAPDCALPAAQLNAAAIESWTDRDGSRASQSIADAVIAQLGQYPAWLQRARQAAEGFSAYSITTVADRYAALMKAVLKREG